MREKSDRPEAGEQHVRDIRQTTRSPSAVRADLRADTALSAPGPLPAVVPDLLPKVEPGLELH
jgi:hypothetical protein